MNIIGFSISDTKTNFPEQDHYSMAYHDPKSLTWSWIIWWTPPWRLKNRTPTMIFPKARFLSKIIGCWHFDTQRKMMRY